MQGDVTLFDAQGQLVVTLQGLLAGRSVTLEQRFELSPRGVARAGPGYQRSHPFRPWSRSLTPP